MLCVDFLLCVNLIFSVIAHLHIGGGGRWWSRVDMNSDLNVAFAELFAIFLSKFAEGRGNVLRFL